MKVARNFFKAITIASTTLLLGLAGCAFDEPIDYTTGGYEAVPQGDAGSGETSESSSLSSKRLSVGLQHTCAINTEGTAQCWGGNDHGQSTVPSNLGAVSSISTYHHHTCAIQTDGIAKCWGQNVDGQSTVPADLGTVRDISTGWAHTCAVTTDNALRCWGWNYDGQTTVPSDLGTVSNVEVGDRHTCALQVDNTLRCWGNRVQLYTDITEPANLGSVNNVSSGAYNNCAVKTDGIAQCWGLNIPGQSAVPSDLGTVSDISARGHHTGYHSCAIKTDGTVRCWGLNGNGQTNVPADLGVVSSISAGGQHTCAMKADNTVSCWGNNSAGQTSVPFNLQSVAAGTVEWTRQLGTAGIDWGTSIASDILGNVFVTGVSQNGGLDGNTSAGLNDIILVKHDSDGVKQWARQIGTSAYEEGYGIAADSVGNIYVSGRTSGGLDGTNLGNYDAIVMKYDNAGNQLWVQQFGTSAWEESHGIAIDSSGNVYVAGHTKGGLEGNINAGREDVFLVKYNSSGLKQWTQQLGTYTHDYMSSITTDSNGNIYVTGSTGGGLDGNTFAGGGFDVFVVKYNSSGVKQWTRQMGTSTWESAFGITTDSSGDVYLTGSTWGSLGGNTNAGYKDLFVVKYDSFGVVQWTKQMGTSSDDLGLGITTDSNGNAYVAGYTNGDLDGNVSAGDDDIFIVKYSGAGVKQWTKLLGSSALDYGKGITVDTNDKIYLTGYTEGDLDGNGNAGSEDIFIMKLK